MNWRVVFVDELKAETPNAIAMGPFGSNIKTDNFVPAGVPVIRGGNVKDGKFNEDDFVFVSDEKADELRASNTFREDVIITHRGTLGQVAMIPPDSRYPRYVVSQSQMKITCNREVAVPRFVTYYFLSPQGQHSLLKHTTQTGVPAISTPLATLRKTKIPLPPLPIQHRIASILGALDDKIECNRRINQTLEQMAQALYKHWFVDFAPFRGEGMVESELGEIPRGWEAKPIGEVVDTLGGGTPSTSNPDLWKDGTINWYVPSDLTRTKTLFVTESSKKTNARGVAESSARLFPAYSVMLTSRATIGEIAINRIEAATNQGFITFVANEKISLYQIVHWLRDNMGKIQANAHGTTFREITRGTMRTFPILVAREAENYIRISKALFDQIESNIVESELLARTRDYLLPKLMSGEIEIKDTEEKVGDSD